jgi:hypothetical protein
MQRRKNPHKFGCENREEFEAGRVSSEVLDVDRDRAGKKR